MQTVRRSGSWWPVIIAGIAAAIWAGQKYSTEEAQRKEKEACTQKASIETSIVSSGKVQLSDLKVLGYAPLRISGRVHNRSGERITDLDVRVSVQDCINGRCDTVFDGRLGGMIDYPSGLLSGGALAPGVSADFQFPNDLKYGKSVSLRGTPQTSVTLAGVTITRPDLPGCVESIGKLVK